MKTLSLLLIQSALLLLGSGYSEKSIVPNFENSTEKIAAFSILQSKCNVCHVNRNRSKIFTLENMDGFAQKINKQVFIKKRMPKGNSIKLSEEERVKLKNWLNTQIIK